MKKLFEALKGKKTYLIGALSLILAGLHEFKIIEPSTYDSWMYILAPLGVMAFRAAVGKVSKVPADGLEVKKN